MAIRKRVTLKDVARESDVSVMTVSNVINGKFRHVTDETRKRVEKAISSLGYRTNLAGKSLRLARRFAIGMIIVDPSPTFIADAYTTNLVAGLSNYLNRQGYGLLLQGTPLKELQDIMMLRQSLVDGLCIFCSGSAAERRAVYEELSRHSEPLIVFQDRLSAQNANVLSLRQDDAAGGGMLADLAAGIGAKKLVYLTLAHRWPALEAREKGIRARLRRWPDASLTVLAAPSGDFDSVQETLAAHVQTHGVPDVVLAGNDQMAIAAQIWLLDQGLDVPRSVKVTGFNAFDFARFARPTLTTIKSPAYEMGELGGREMLARLASGQFSRSDIVLPVKLERGNSA